MPVIQQLGSIQAHVLLYYGQPCGNTPPGTPEGNTAPTSASSGGGSDPADQAETNGQNAGKSAPLIFTPRDSEPRESVPLPPAENIREGYTPSDPMPPEVYIVPAFGPGILINVRYEDGVKNIFNSVDQPSADPVDPSDILMPNGKPIGKPGKGAGVRVVEGGAAAAAALWAQLSGQGRDITPVNHRGQLVQHDDGAIYGYRPVSGEGDPAIDINDPEVPFEKIHFGF